MVSEHMVDKEISHISRRAGFDARRKAHHFSQAVNKDQNTGVRIAKGKVSDKVHANTEPWGTGNGHGV